MSNGNPREHYHGDCESDCLSSLTDLILSLFRQNSANTDDDDPAEYHTTTHPPVAPMLFPEWTSTELETLINRWTCTYPGPLTHPQNVEIQSLITVLDSSVHSVTDASILHASLLHRLKMDHNVERVAHEIGLKWIPAEAAHELPHFASGVLGIEEFEPPPGTPLTTEARRLLLGCNGEWKELVMPLPAVGVRMRYRKPKYWIVSVAAVCGLSSAQLDERMDGWFRRKAASGVVVFE